jgi:hypothetical protein
VLEPPISSGGERSPFREVRRRGVRRSRSSTFQYTTANVTADAVASEAQDLLEQPEIWSGVEQVAGDLLRYGDLDYEGIRNAVMFNDLIGVKRLVTTKGNSRQDELRRAGWSESQIGTGRRVLSREEAERKIREKSPPGASRISRNQEVERR